MLGFDLSDPSLNFAVLALTADQPERLVICNGFKEARYVEFAVLAAKLGRRSSRWSRTSMNSISCSRRRRGSGCDRASASGVPDTIEWVDGRPRAASGEVRPDALRDPRGGRASPEPGTTRPVAAPPLPQEPDARHQAGDPGRRRADPHPRRTHAARRIDPVPRRGRGPGDRLRRQPVEHALQSQLHDRGVRGQRRASGEVDLRGGGGRDADDRHRERTGDGRPAERARLRRPRDQLVRAPPTSRVGRGTRPPGRFGAAPAPRRPVRGLDST